MELSMQTNDRDNESTQRRDERDSRSRDEREPRSRSNETVASGWTFDEIGITQAYTTVGGMNDSVINEFKKVLENAGKDDAPGTRPELKREKFKLVAVPPSRFTSDAPSMLVTLAGQINNDRVTFIYVLLFERPGPQVRRQIEDRHDRYDALVLPENISPKYAEEIRKRVSEPGARVVMVGSQVVPASLTAKIDPNKDNESLVVPILNNAFNAICTLFEDYERSATGRKDVGKRITPSALGKGQRLEVRYDHSGQVVTDTSGLPVAADIVADLSISIADDESGGRERTYFQQQVMKVSASIDLYVTDPERENDRGRGYSRRDRDRIVPFLQPVLNITQISPATSTMPYNLGSVLLALDTIIQQTNDLKWSRGLQPRPFVEGSSQRRRQILNLGYIPTLNPDDRNAVPIDLSPDMTDDDIFEFLDAHLVDRVAVGMIISKTGDRSWVSGFFSALAADPRDRRLQEILIREADILTGGRFSEFADRADLFKGDVVSMIPTKALIGTWRDEDGNERALTEWNVATVRSYLKNSPRADEIAADFQRTFEDTTRSIDANLAERFDILNRFVPEVRVLATGDMVVLSDLFMEVLSESIAAARMDAVPVAGDAGIQRNRPTGLGYGDYAGRDMGARSNRREGGRGRGRGNYDLAGSDRYN